MEAIRESGVDFLDVSGCRTDSRVVGDAHAVVYASQELAPSGCAKCHVKRLCLAGQRTRGFWDVPHLGLPTRVELIVPSFACVACGHIFEAPIEWLHPTRKMTWRLVDYILTRVALWEPFVTMADDTGQYVTTIMDVFLEAFAKWEEAHGKSLPTHLGIDEKYLSGACYTILVDVQPGLARSVDLLRDKTDDTIQRRLLEAPNLDDVRFVTMDFSEQFRRIIFATLPNAKVVADHFHYAQIIQDGFNEALKHVMRGMKGQFVKTMLSRYTEAERSAPLLAEFFAAEKHKLRRVAKKRRKELNKYRRRLKKHPDNLSDQELVWVDQILKEHPVLYKAYQVKNAGLDIIPTADRRKTKAVMRAEHVTEGDVHRRLDDWMRSTEGQMSRFYSKARRIIPRWRDEIARIVSTGLSNATAESKNRLISVIYAQARGLQFETLRARLLWADAYRSAGNRLPEIK